jgi:hypothetical protein
MKRFILIFFGILLFEIGFGLLTLQYTNSIFSFIKFLICLPLSLIDRSYPFYAEGSPYFCLFLTLINISIQTLIIIFIYSKLNFKNKKN